MPDMYEHFLVPVDGTSASDKNVKAAIDLAEKLNAKITFLHAAPDPAATRAVTDTMLMALHETTDPSVIGRHIMLVPDPRRE